jgi:hypothetical protein
MSDMSPDSAPVGEESGPAADLAAGPASAADEARLTAPIGTPATEPGPSGAQWPSAPAAGFGAPDPGGFQPPSGPPPASGFGAPDPGGFQSPSGPPPASGFGAPNPGAFQSPFGAPPPGAYPGYPPTGQRPPRRMRGPLIGFIAGAVAVALAVGGYAIASNLSNSANKPISTSVHSKATGITVAGHGIQLTFPAGWQNVPTSPNQLRQFINNFTAKFHHIPSQLQSEISNSQVMSSFAMLVYHFNSQGNATENLNAIVETGSLPASEMISELRSGQGPAEFGATNIQYSTTTFGSYPGVIVTYSLQVAGLTAYGAQSYLEGPSKVVITTITSSSATTSEADLRKIVATIKFV